VNFNLSPTIHEQATSRRPAQSFQAAMVLLLILGLSPVHLLFTPRRPNSSRSRVKARAALLEKAATMSSSFISFPDP
jgi:hypothetical protein